MSTQQAICLYFQVHQPFRHKKYSFFDIGNDHYYYDDYLNESILHRVAEKCYLPTNQLLHDLIVKHNKKFKIAFSISGIALDQFELYSPEVIDSFRKLVKTGCVELLAETYSHSLISLKNKNIFTQQVKQHHNKIKSIFNVKPKVFRNTELIYSDMIGQDVFEMGYNGMLAEGAKHILGWKTPNYVYYNVLNPKLKLLLRNYSLSDDIAFRFSDKNWSSYPLTAEKYTNWIKQIDDNEEVVNLFMDYETFGEHQKKDTGILNFLEKFVNLVVKKTHFKFKTPSEIFETNKPIAPISAPHAISWADEERDITAWLGNDMQKEAFDKLYNLFDKISLCKDKNILTDWNYLQTSDYFYYISTKWFSDGAVHAYFTPYNSPYDAFINFMNILADFNIRIDKHLESRGILKDQMELIVKLEQKGNLIKKLEREINILKGITSKTTQKRKVKNIPE